jgi:hypothetical protein
MTPNCYLIDALNQVLTWDISTEACPRAIHDQAALLSALSSDEIGDVLH